MQLGFAFPRRQHGRLRRHMAVAGSQAKPAQLPGAGKWHKILRLDKYLSRKDIEKKHVVSFESRHAVGQFQICIISVFPDDRIGGEQKNIKEGNYYGRQQIIDQEF